MRPMVQMRIHVRHYGFTKVGFCQDIMKGRETGKGVKGDYRGMIKIGHGTSKDKEYLYAQ